MKKKLITFCLLMLGIIIFSACDSQVKYSENVIKEGETKEVESKEVEDNKLLEGGGLIFTFDDGCSTDYEVVYPILKEKGLEAVTYISPIFIEDEMDGFMDWEQVKALDEAGWDIEDHTYSHVNLEELTKEEINKEMQKINDIFEKKGLDTPKHHALPYGEYNETAKEVVLTYRDTVRTAENNLNSYPLEDDILDAVDMGIHSEEVLKGFIDRAVLENKVLIFFTHDVQENPYDYGITTEKFESVLEYAIEKEINILTLSELMKY
ncbi:polysaccharide deacetylase family protein [Natranaerofaba carboxydovora]|uniref:polysaccharide deacetylase family protein n=1 Tax=Natranaerofaba carboxydovora TaxID=2742683 RepID=UPI001F133C21|nr:polysaccharide deacetylase family protein [Natranaerofaba carboxydovora]UMZ75466.1 Polysaccharide deacetylase [Natranaerofaba carboxydovora]